MLLGTLHLTDYIGNSILTAVLKDVLGIKFHRIICFQGSSSIDRNKIGVYKQLIYLK